MFEFTGRLTAIGRFLFFAIFNTCVFFVWKFIPSRFPKSFDFPVFYDGHEFSFDAAIDQPITHGLSLVFTGFVVTVAPLVVLFWTQLHAFVPDVWFVTAAFTSLLATGDLVTWWILLKLVITVPRPTFLSICEPSYVAVKHPHPDAGISIGFPFGGRRTSARFETELLCPLGSTNPRLKATQIIERSTPFGGYHDQSRSYGLFSTLLTTGDLITWWTVFLESLFTVPQPALLSVCEPIPEVWPIPRIWEGSQPFQIARLSRLT